MAWEDFGEIRKDNYLIIKENHIAESIQPFVSTWSCNDWNIYTVASMNHVFRDIFIASQAGTTLALDGQLHVREPKRKDWKLSPVVLKNGYMVMDKSKVG